MDTARGLQEVVTRNVRVLMALRDITSQKDLVAMLGSGWDGPKLNRSLNGSRRWALDDLPALAEAFGTTPAALLGDTADLVGAVHPAPTGTSVSRGGRALYRASNNTIIPFPLDRRPRAHRRWLRLTRPAQIITLRRDGGSDHSAPLSGTSLATVTRVTAVVGS